MPAFYKIAFSKKTKSFGTFCLFFLDSMDVWYYLSSYLKRFIDKCSLQTLIYSQLQAKLLVITHEKDNAVMMVLSYRLQQNENSELHFI